MKISLKRTPEQIELVKAMASRNADIAYEAQQSLAELMAPVLAQVINQAPTVSNLFNPYPYDAEDSPSLPLDLYADVKDAGYLRVWQQQNAGGLATNEVYEPTQELKFKTYRIETAVSFDRSHAAKSRLDVVAKSFDRLAQEILIQQEKTSANLLFGALAAATTNGKQHVQRANTSGRFLPEDCNTIDTLLKRIWTSWYGGTPLQGRHHVTDMLISPEVTQELRRMAYNAINTKSSPVGADTNGITAPDAYRDSVFNSAGIPELWNINFLEINELGRGQRFNTVFDTLANAASLSYSTALGAGTASFAGANEEIILGMDRSVNSLYRGMAIDSDVGSEIVLGADNQFFRTRQNKIGWYGQAEEGRMVIDDRALVGVIVKGL